MEDLTARIIRALRKGASRLSADEGAELNTLADALDAEGSIAFAAPARDVQVAVGPEAVAEVLTNEPAPVVEMTAEPAPAGEDHAS